MAHVPPREILRRLRAIQPELQRIPNLNYGGCCVVAAVVAEALERLGVPVEVVSTAYSENNVPANARAVLREAGHEPTSMGNYAWDGAGLYRSHLGVRFKLYGVLHTWDSQALWRTGRAFGGSNDCGEPRDACDYPFGKGLTVQEAQVLADDPLGWNSSFNRVHIPLVRRIVLGGLLCD